MSSAFALSQSAERQSWFSSQCGQRLIDAEQREVIPLLTSYIGVRGLYLRPTPVVPAALSGNMLQSVVSLHRPDHAGEYDGALRCSENGLPFESNSLCLVYALHALDTCVDPAALVDELRRTLKPEGVLFVIGLSPISSWRLKWNRGGARPLAPARVRALLAAAGLTVELQVGLGPLWPGQVEKRSLSGVADRRSGTLFDRWRAGYLLIARKRRPTLTAIGKRQRSSVGVRAPVGTA